jgi:hypothetical protein
MRRLLTCEHEVYPYVTGAWGRYTHSMGQICLRCGRQWADTNTRTFVPAREQRRSDARWLKSARRTA